MRITLNPNELNLQSKNDRKCLNRDKEIICSGIYVDPLSPHFISGEAFFDVPVNATKHVKTKTKSQIELNVCSPKTQVATNSCFLSSIARLRTNLAMNENIGYNHFNMFQGNICINIHVCFD